MKRALGLMLVPLATAVLACSPPSAEDLVRQVMRQRQQYDVTLTSWIVRDGTAVPTLYLEVLVVNNNQDVTLRTVTALVEQIDADGNVLATQRVPIDTSAFTPGLGQSIGVEVIPADPAVDGIRLFVESTPAREVWDQFREFDAVRPRI